MARHMRPRGLVAIALSPELEQWSVRDGAAAPPSDACERDGTAYFSQPTAICLEPDGHLLERRRETVSPAGYRTVEIDRIRLDRLTADQLEHDGAASGLLPAGRTTIPPTPDYAGSEVVLFRG